LASAGTTLMATRATSCGLSKLTILTPDVLSIGVAL